MKRKIILFFVIVLSMISVKSQLIRNNDRLKDMQHILLVQQQLTSSRTNNMWKFIQEPMPNDEKQALRFLYAYMPLSDLADYTPSFFRANIKQSLQARDEMKWGKTVPEEVFLHFVLPVRVNNENLDSFRMVMYPELKKRVKGLSMRQAALEVNHWCHEKVTYRGTDARTSAPLSTVKKSFGRCGEESTFTVTALRTVGIPARQVYTPRWAHSDDNHAWVEVWVEGKWYYLGACEPDVDLNMGWFSEPATRAMLVHTRAYGRYYGNEPVVVTNDRFSELNLTSHYATVKNVIVKVKDEKGQPVDSAKVEFKLYNYAEYYPIATNYTKNGITQLTTGMGDLLVWASSKGKFGYAKLSVSTTDTLVITLNKSFLNGVTDNYLMIPPKVGKTETVATEAQIQANSLRLTHEDSIRSAYMSTFKDSVWATNLAQRLKLSPDTVKKVIAKSYGNWDQVTAYLEAGTKISRQYVLALLMQLSDKDFSDMKATILLSQLSSAIGRRQYSDDCDEETYLKQVLAPRIANENLSPWRNFLYRNFGREMALKAKQNIAVLTDWILQNIHIDEKANLHSRSPLSPEGVYRLRVADKQSRDIFFVAACRSFGIAARLNQATQEPEYYHKGEWHKVMFSAQSQQQPVEGELQLVNGDNLVEPQYYLHFTIGKLIDGSYKTLEFEEEKRLSEFPKKIDLEVGYYVLITGNRQADGSVLSSCSYFKISPDSTTTVKVELLKQTDELKPSAKLELRDLHIQLIDSSKNSSLSDLAKGEQMVLVLFDPDKEPSKHILNDLAPYSDFFNQTKTLFVFATSSKKMNGINVLNTYTLPANYITGFDDKDNILTAISAEYGQSSKDKLPLVLFCDGVGNVYYFSNGYRIGAGEQLVRIKKQIDAKKPCNSTKMTCTKP